MCEVNNNNINQFPQQIISLPKLNDLDISANMIEQIPYEVIGIKNLKLFYLQENPITEKQELREDLIPIINVLFNRGVTVNH